MDEYAMELDGFVAAEYNDLPAADIMFLQEWGRMMLAEPHPKLDAPLSHPAHQRYSAYVAANRDRVSKFARSSERIGHKVFELQVRTIVVATTVIVALQNPVGRIM